MRAMALVVLMMVLSGCVVARGELPAPPSENDLHNDGSAEQKQALIHRYGIHGESKVVAPGVRVGDAVRTRSRYPVATGLPDDVKGYISSDAAAAALLPSNFLAWGPPVLILTAIATLPFFLAAQLAAGVVTIKDGADYQAGRPRSDAQRTANNVATAYLFLGLPVVLVTLGALMVAAFVVQSLRTTAEDRAINTFNLNLARRVDAAASK